MNFQENVALLTNVGSPDLGSYRSFMHSSFSVSLITKQGGNECLPRHCFILVAGFPRLGPHVLPLRPLKDVSEVRNDLGRRLLESVIAIW